MVVAEDLVAMEAIHGISFPYKSEVFGYLFISLSANPSYGSSRAVTLYQQAAINITTILRSESEEQMIDPTEEVSSKSIYIICS